uniref:cadherin repeat domain-containing protein n=5 Tax=Flavobacterium sp. TaxID=239 RepID=UPI004048DDFC
YVIIKKYVMKIKNLTLSILALSFLTVSCSSDDDANTASVNLQDLAVTIDENPTNGQVIGTVQSNSANPLTFSIVSQSPSGALEIDATTGELTVLDAGVYDFETNPTITAVISSSEAVNTATVTVNLVNVNEIGDFNYGGIVFWVNPTDNTKGLVCAVTDQSSSIRWHDTQQPSITGTTSTSLQTGSTNTDLIIASLGNNFAAGVARAYNGGGFTDWFLPSVDELKEMANNRAVIDATAAANSGTALVAEPWNVSNGYWSSSQQSNGGSVYLVNLLTAGENGGFAINFASVRAVRAFE